MFFIIKLILLFIFTFWLEKKIDLMEKVSTTASYWLKMKQPTARALAFAMYTTLLTILTSLLF